MTYLSKEFKVAVAIYELTNVMGIEATRVGVSQLVSNYMNSGELTASIHMLESWGILRRRVSNKMISTYHIGDGDLVSIQRLHDMCWGKTKTG